MLDEQPAEGYFAFEGDLSASFDAAIDVPHTHVQVSFDVDYDTYRSMLYEEDHPGAETPVEITAKAAGRTLERHRIEPYWSEQGTEGRGRFEEDHSVERDASFVGLLQPYWRSSYLFPHTSGDLTVEFAASGLLPEGYEDEYESFSVSYLTIAAIAPDVSVTTLPDYGGDPSAAEPQGPGGAADPGKFRVFRSGAPIGESLDVNYKIEGISASDIEEPLNGFVTIPPNSTFADVPITPRADDEVEAAEAAALTLLAGDDYVVPDATPAIVTLALSTRFHVANDTVRSIYTSQHGALVNLSVSTTTGKGTLRVKYLMESADGDPPSTETHFYQYNSAGGPVPAGMILNGNILSIEVSADTETDGTLTKE